MFLPSTCMCPVDACLQCALWPLGRSLSWQWQLIMATLPCLSLPMCNNGKSESGAHPSQAFALQKPARFDIQTTFYSSLKSRGTHLSMRARVLLRP